MTYLVDANVLREPTKPDPDPRAVAWLRRHERELVIDPVTLGEVQFGILLLSPGSRRRRLERWFDTGIRRVACLPWEAATGLRWAQLLAELRAAGRAMPIKDNLTAATALSRGLTIAARSRADFLQAGVRSVDPFAAGV